jgi:hypothetical protein
MRLPSAPCPEAAGLATGSAEVSTHLGRRRRNLPDAGARRTSWRSPSPWRIEHGQPGTGGQACRSGRSSRCRTTRHSSTGWSGSPTSRRSRQATWRSGRDDGVSCTAAAPGPSGRRRVTRADRHPSPMSFAKRGRYTSRGYLTWPFGTFLARILTGVQKMQVLERNRTVPSSPDEVPWVKCAAP